MDIPALPLCPAVLKEELGILPIVHNLGVFGRWCDAYSNIIRNAWDSWDVGKEQIPCQ